MRGSDFRVYLWGILRLMITGLHHEDGGAVKYYVVH